MKRLKINEKEAGVGPFKKKNKTKYKIEHPSCTAFSYLIDCSSWLALIIRSIIWLIKIEGSRICSCSSRKVFGKTAMDTFDDEPVRD